MLALDVPTLDSIIINVYRPPKTPTSNFRNLIEEIKTTINNYEVNKEIVLVGDFNFPQINWENETMQGSSSKEDKEQATLLLELMKNNYFCQIIQHPTRGNNILDLVMIRNWDLIHSYEIVKTLFSDHNFITIKTNKRKNETSDFCPRTLNNFQKLNFHNKNISWSIIKQRIGAINWDEKLNESDINQMYSTIIKELLKISEELVPVKNKTNNKNTN